MYDDDRLSTARRNLCKYLELLKIKVTLFTTQCINRFLNVNNVAFFSYLTTSSDRVVSHYCDAAAIPAELHYQDIFAAADYDPVFSCHLIVRLDSAVHAAVAAAVEAPKWSNLLSASIVVALLMVASRLFH